MKKMKKVLRLLTLALFSFAVLTGCGSSTEKLKDPDTIETYGTVLWGDEVIDVCFTHDQEKLYIYYDDDDYALFQAIDLPVDEFHDDDNDWYIISIDLDDLTDDDYSDLRLEIAHSDSIKSSILWTWSPDKSCFIYQPTNSFFYIKDEIDDTTSKEYPEYEGIWTCDEDNMYQDLYIVIDLEGEWSLYSGSELIDNGYLYELTGEGTHVYSYNDGALNGGRISMEGSRMLIDTAGYFNNADGTEDN